MARIATAALAALLWLGASGVHAQGGLTRGWYAGAEIGQSKLERDDFIGITSEDDSSEAYALLFGYRFSRYFSLEAGYTDMGDFHATVLPDCPSCVEESVSTSIDGFFVNAIGTWPIAEYFQLRGLLGMTERDLAISSVSSQFSTSWSESGTSLSYGIGVGIPINEHFEIDLDLVRYTEIGIGLTLDSSLGTYDQTEATLALLGVRFHF